MKLKLKRIYRGADYTIGHLYIDGVWFCDTLEDTCRITDCNCDDKIYGRTAIPEGVYSFIMVYLPKYGRNVPLLLDVPCFTGILMHAGNTIEDTEGCILCGKNKLKGKVLHSRITINELTLVLESSEQYQFEIEIV